MSLVMAQTLVVSSPNFSSITSTMYIRRPFDCLSLDTKPLPWVRPVTTERDVDDDVLQPERKVCNTERNSEFLFLKHSKKKVLLVLAPACMGHILSGNLFLLKCKYLISCSSNAFFYCLYCFFNRLCLTFQTFSVAFSRFLVFLVKLCFWVSAFSSTKRSVDTPSHG